MVNFLYELLGIFLWFLFVFLLSRDLLLNFGHLLIHVRKLFVLLKILVRGRNLGLVHWEKLALLLLKHYFILCLKWWLRDENLNGIAWHLWLLFFGLRVQMRDWFDLLIGNQFIWRLERVSFQTLTKTDELLIADTIHVRTGKLIIIFRRLHWLHNANRIMSDDITQIKMMIWYIKIILWCVYFRSCRKNASDWFLHIC